MPAALSFVPLDAALQMSATVVCGGGGGHNIMAEIIIA